MTVRRIKNADGKTRKLVKKIAKSEIAKEYGGKPSAAWSKILNAKPTLTKSEAAAMLKNIAKMRKMKKW